MADIKQFKAEPLEIHVGCLCCGGGEMRDKGNEIVAALDTRIYGGFGSWHIECDGEVIYQPEGDKEWDEYPTLMTFENQARKDPDRDWRAVCYLPLRGATYQRQGDNRWVLIESNMGFA